jgi:hypothetical protein
MALNLEAFVPYLGAVGQALVDLDENKTGADDFAGALLVYAAEVISAVLNDEDLPEFPEILKAGTSDKISGVSRAILIVANSALTIARFQVSGIAAKVLKYISQAVSQLLAGQPVVAASF